jgi:hypothetical protein
VQAKWVKKAEKAREHYQMEMKDFLVIELSTVFFRSSLCPCRYFLYSSPRSCVVSSSLGTSGIHWLQQTHPEAVRGKDLKVRTLAIVVTEPCQPVAHLECAYQIEPCKPAVKCSG